MGKRSRKRGTPAGDDATASATGTSRAQRDAARARRAEAARRRSAAATSTPRQRRRRGRPTIDERPPAPWGKFPLVELVVLLALILLPLSFVVGGARGKVMLTFALVFGSLGGIGLPLGCLYVGSRVQDATHSVGVALLAMAAGIVVGIFAIVPLLGYLNRKQ